MNLRGKSWLLALPVIFLVSPAAGELKPSNCPATPCPCGGACPSLGILLSIATGPVLYPHVWEHHYGKITLGWTILVAVSDADRITASTITLRSVLHTVLLEYLPFIILLFALFTIAGGILVRGNIHGTPLDQCRPLGIGSVLASFVGTTGASMIMIRPVIRANDNRRFNAHVVVFFIFLVSNIGGALTPLGDPPLFVGFLRGVDFFWTTEHLLPRDAVRRGIVLAAFLLLDWLSAPSKENGAPKIKDPTPDSRVTIRGLPNFLLLGGVIARRS